MGEDIDSFFSFLGLQKSLFAKVVRTILAIELAQSKDFRHI